MSNHRWLLPVVGLRSLSLTAVAAGSVHGVTQAGVTNLVQDGSFETPSTLVGTYSVFPGGAAIGAWASTGTEIALVNGAYSSDGFTYQAQSGSQWLDLSGASNPRPTNRVSQLVATDVGLQYELSFYLGSAWGGPPQMLQPIVEVTVGSGPGMTFTNTNPAIGGQMNWQFFSLTFTAATSTTEIGFRYSNAPSPLNYVVGIDTVSMVVVPAPGALEMLMACSVGGTRRRLRR
jgi:hypothetical protein